MGDMPENEYELAQLRRIEGNKRVMAQLNLPSLSLACSVVKKKQVKRAPRGPRKAPQPATRMQPARACRERISVTDEPEPSEASLDKGQGESAQERKKEISLREAIVSAWHSWDDGALNRVVKILEDNGVSPADLVAGLLTKDLADMIGIDPVSYHKLSHVWKATAGR